MIVSHLSLQPNQSRLDQTQPDEIQPDDTSPARRLPIAAHDCSTSIAART
jgi:hypothetical protein